MLTRRQFGLGLANVATMRSVGPAAAASAAPSTDVTFTAYAMPTQLHPIKALHRWPLDHTCVATSSGMSWGCYGRTYAEEPTISTAIAEGRGDDLWAAAIAGPDGHAGIDYGVTGVCDQCSNRILLPAGITVKNSPGDEIAVLLCGIYGLALGAFVTRVKDAAASVNRAHPGRISDAKVVAAVARIGGGLTSEREVVRTNTERLIRPVLGPRYDALAPDIDELYLAFHDKREALTAAWERGSIDKRTLVAKVRAGFVEALGDLRDVIGAPSYARIVPVPPHVAGDFVFFQERP